MTKKVSFAEDAKSFDGSRCDVIECYKIISGFFNIPSMNNEKVGLSQEVIDRLIENDQVCRIRTLMRLSTKIISRKLIIKVKSSEDCLKVCSNKEILHACLDNLKRTVLTISSADVDEEQKSAIMNIDDEEEKSLREFWEKKCGNRSCREKLCCLDKKTLQRKKRKSSLIRSGTRDYGLSIEPCHLNGVMELTAIITQAIDALDCQEEQDFFAELYNEKLVMV